MLIVNSPGVVAGVNKGTLGGDEGEDDQTLPCGVDGQN